jgi:hypothetical protein
MGELLTSSASASEASSLWVITKGIPSIIVVAASGAKHSEAILILRLVSSIRMLKLAFIW